MDTISNHEESFSNPSGSQAGPLIRFDFTIHRYLPFAAFFLLLNGAGLPHGLFYTTLLSPLFFLWLYLKGQRWLTTKFLLLLSPFLVVQFATGVQSPFYYLRSLFLLWTAYVTVYALAFGLLRIREIEQLFDELIVVNFGAVLIALVLFFTPLRELLWMDTSDTLSDRSHLLRLSMLCSEPSVYAELMLPLIIFASLRLLVAPSRRSILYFATICVPLLLTQSFGGLSISFAAIGLSLLISYRRLLGKPRSLLIMAGLVSVATVVILVPNPIAARLSQVITGSDSSTQSRTIFSFIVGYAVASSKSVWWGAGLGQGKIVDVSDLGLGFTIGVIPNAVAGTFAELGLVGVLVRLGAELILFFKTRVYLNSFRFALFVAAFLVQFTGSHLMDVQQYLMWCFAFLPFFPTLNLKSARPPVSLSPETIHA